MSPVLIGEVLSVAMFVAMLFAVMIGYPVAFTLAGIGLIFAAIGLGFGVFDPVDLDAFERFLADELADPSSP